MKQKLTKEEYGLVVSEIAERVKDIIATKAEKNVRREITKRFCESILDDDTEPGITIKYDINLCFGDIQQIVSRARRFAQKDVRKK